MPSNKSDVLVIGGGVIGMSCAQHLSERGAQVTVLDKGEMGYGCSYGNAGWLTPCFALPLPMPGMLLKSIRWLLDPVSPLYIKPEPSILLLRWLTRFLFSMNESQMVRSVEALTEISKYSLDAYAKLNDRYPGALSFERKGLLMVAQSKGGVAAAIQEMDLVEKHGVPGRRMSPDDIRALEPALTGKLEGGVYFPQEAHAEPLAVVQAMARAATENGAVLHPRTETFEFKTQGDRITGVRTTKGWFEAEQIVLATGSWSHSVSRQLDLRVPVLGGKGYALIVKPFAPAPQTPIMLIEKKVAVTPRKDSIRLAGTLELCNQDDSINARRVDAILHGARQFMNVPADPEISEIWRGLRPCTPDGVPVIGYSKSYANLLLATGHQMLGLQSAPGTGRLIADLATGAKPTFNPEPFRVDRF